MNCVEKGAEITPADIPTIEQMKNNMSEAVKKQWLEIEDVIGSKKNERQAVERQTIQKQ